MTTTREYQTIKEAMALYHVGYQTVYLAVKRGDIEAYKPGKTLLLSGESLEAWFRTKKVAARKPVGRPRRGARR